MPNAPVKKKRRTYLQLIVLGLVWAGFVFFLEHLAKGEAGEIDYTGNEGLGQMVWAVKFFGIAAALVGVVLLVRTYKKGGSDG